MYQVEESIINLVYDPINGLCVSDGKIDDVCDSVEKLGKFRFDSDNPTIRDFHSIIVGSLLIVDELRARMVEGRLKINRLVYRYTDKLTKTTKDIDMEIDKNAMIEFCPEGFCDYNEKSLLRILWGKND